MASVLIVDDEPAITSALGLYFERSGGHTVVSAHTGTEGLDAVKRARPDLVLLDVRLPDMTGFDVLDEICHGHAAVVMMTAYGDVPLAVQAIQRGAENFLIKPIELPHLGAVAERAFEKARLRQMNAYLASRLGHATAPVLLGSSAPMRELLSQIEMLAAADKTTVLLIGESGSGKRRVAELIHAHSVRATNPLMDVNCAKSSNGLLDAELFGTDRGDAGETTGLLDVALGGTLFVDEIADLDAHLQPKLLRVLEGKGFRRAGGTRDIAANVRVIAATGRDLVNEVTAGAFREDLYYRLNIMPVYLPPLRARSREDLVELVAHVLDELQPMLPDAPVKVSDDALDRILHYPWPGNIRELRNVLERAMMMARGQPAIGLSHLAQDVREAISSGADHHIPKSLVEVERLHIERTLHVHEGNRTHAARELAISRATLIKKIRQYGL